MRKVYDFTENILILMYILDKAGMSLNLVQLTTIITDTTEMNYFDVTVAVDHLQEQKLLNSHETSNGLFYSLTIEGRRALGMFLSKIRGSVRDSIDLFLYDNAKELKLQTELYADYVPSTDGTYIVVLRAFDKQKIIFEMSLTAPDITTAHLLADNWQKKATSIHSTIYELLSND